jgi:putative tributyrin esterase
MLRLRGVLVLSVVSALCAGAQPTLVPRAPVLRGVVRADTLWSQALGVRKRLVVYLPPSYDVQDAAKPRRFPVAVYLHGAWGDESDWTVQGRLAETMDSLIAAGMREMIIAMPDGDDGWWTTWHGLNDVAACRRAERKERAESYCVPWPKYDDYVVHDVVAFVDSAYRTIGTSASRGIAGLSMGGFGAITIAARSPDTFSVAASHSGVLRPALIADSSALATGGTVVLRDARSPAEIRTAAGRLWDIMQPAFGADSVSWMSRDPSRLLAQLQERGGAMPALMVDVGTDDFLYVQNRTFRDAMSTLHIPLTYAEWSGQHDWAYWRAHLPESLQFIAKHIAR